MPSFDIVSEINQVEVRNAVDQANKEVGNRFDFTGSVMVITACGPERPQYSSLYIGECSECSFKSESRNQWPSSVI